MMSEIVNSEIVMLITNLNPGLFYFSSWLPENFSDADADADSHRHRQVKEQPESEASLGCGG